MSPSAINLMTISAMKITAKTSHSTGDLAEGARKNNYKINQHVKIRTEILNNQLESWKKPHLCQKGWIRRCNKYHGLPWLDQPMPATNPCKQDPTIIGQEFLCLFQKTQAIKHIKTWLWLHECRRKNRFTQVQFKKPVSVGLNFEQSAVSSCEKKKKTSTLQGN